MTKSGHNVLLASGESGKYFHAVLMDNKEAFITRPCSRSLSVEIVITAGDSLGWKVIINQISEENVLNCKAMR